ncbi:hypothetical protein GVN20_05730 [Runella sp. CRIBMP]|uniref:hypothetical protein n=1 Tax=Runella sp. CRIBMP TaxID=2683261 RepID=UPI0014126D24|nr:hypothetical protein [Runella sp. CRIBMP]NBB18850.1 hypothetical protein [Runella sp. CRIBMP]
MRVEVLSEFFPGTRMVHIHSAFGNPELIDYEKQATHNGDSSGKNISHYKG